MPKIFNRKSHERKVKAGKFGPATFVFILIALFFFAVAIWFDVNDAVIVGKSLPGKYGTGGGREQVLTVPFLYFLGIIFAAFPILDLVQYLIQEYRRRNEIKRD